MERLTIVTETGVALKLDDPKTDEGAKKQLMSKYLIDVKMKSLEKSKGYLMLRKIADDNIAANWQEERVNETFDWAIKRAEHYATKLNIPISDILISWSEQCNISFVNYFQDCNQPKIDNDNVRVFETVDDLIKAVGKRQYRCPACGGVSVDPYECKKDVKEKKSKDCNWKAYGLLGVLGKGVYVYCKDQLKGNQIFMPIEWETNK